MEMVKFCVIAFPEAALNKKVELECGCAPTFHNLLLQSARQLRKCEDVECSRHCIPHKHSKSQKFRALAIAYWRAYILTRIKDEITEGMVAIINC